MANDPENDAALVALLHAARGAEVPDTGLMARVLADADAVQDEISRVPPPRAKPAPSYRSWLAGLADTFGGWPALSGVGLAGLAGIAIGFYAPDMVDTFVGGQIWSLSGGLSATPELGALWLEASDV